MKKMKWKRWVMLLSLLLVVATVSAYTIGFYTANAAVASYEISDKNFFTSGKYAACFDYGVGGDKDVSRIALTSGKLDLLYEVGKSTNPCNDPFIGMTKGDTAYQLNYDAAAGDIIQVSLVYKNMGTLSSGASLTAPAIYFANSSNDYGTSGWSTGTTTPNYSDTTNYQIISAVVPTNVVNGGEIDWIRLDPFNVKDGTISQFHVRVNYIYVGPPQNAPTQEGVTVNFYNPKSGNTSVSAGTKLQTVKLAYNSTYAQAFAKYQATYGEPVYGTAYGSVTASSSSAETTYDFCGWRANNNSNICVMNPKGITSNVYGTGDTTRITGTKNFVAVYTPYYRYRIYNIKGSYQAAYYVGYGSTLNASGLTSVPADWTATYYATNNNIANGVMYTFGNSWTLKCTVTNETATTVPNADFLKFTAGSAISSVIRTNVDLYANKVTHYKISFFDKNGGSLATAQYVQAGQKISTKYASEPSAPNVSGSDATHRYEKNGSMWLWDSATGTNAMAWSNVANIVPTAARNLYAQYYTAYRVRFLGGSVASTSASAPNTEGTYSNVTLATQYVKSGQKVNTVYSSVSSLPNAATNLGYMFREDTNGNNARLVFTSKWHVGSRTGTPKTESELLTTTINQAADFYADYGKQFAVWYHSKSGLINWDKYSDETKKAWVASGAKASANGVPEDLVGAVDGKTFVSWVSTGSRAACNGSPSGTAVDPTNLTVTGPLFLHPRFLDNNFIGSSTNGLVFKRTVTEIDPSTYEYQVRVDLYSYKNAVTTPIDIIESFMGPFESVPGKQAQIFFQAYLGNGKFDESELNYAQAGGYQKQVTRTTNAGQYGYVYDKSTSSKVWKTVKFSGSAHDAYSTVKVRFFDADFKTYAANESGSTKTQVATNIDAVRAGMVCNEYDSTNTSDNPYKTFPKGFRIVLLYNIRLNENGTMGGNNYDLSHKNYTKIVANGETYNFHDSQYASTCVYKNDSGTTVTKTEQEPNVNIAINYDFVVHDYYMDLLDYDNQKSGVTDNQRVIGLLTALRNDKLTNHELIYGRMYSHGNVNVYKDTLYNPDGKYDMPNTDIDGTRNSRVNIYYTVTHENGKLVYATHILGNETIENSHTVAHVDTSKEWADVDFTKDHKVTVNVKVVPISKLTDSFGNAAQTSNWEHSAEAYFFAPRFIVADYGRAVAVDLQREGQHGKDYGFVETPSYVFRTKYNVGGTETIKLKVGSQTVTPSETKNYETGTGLRFQIRAGTVKDSYVLYAFNNTGTLNQQPGNGQKMLEDCKVASYTTDVINHLKYSEATTVTRNVYVIPANNVLYHEHFMDFTKGRTVTNSALNWQPKYTSGTTLNTYVVYNTSDAYGYSKYVQNMMDTTNGDYGERVMVATPNKTTRNVYGNFTFKGTGFEILSRSGNDTGVLVAEVYSGSTLVKRFLVDTYLANTTMYQVPVIQCTGLAYGTYTVEFRAYYHEIFDHAKSYRSGAFTPTEQEIRDALGLSADEPLEYTLSTSGYGNGAATRGTDSYNVYVDGVRIYNPLGNVTRSTETIEKTYSDGTNEKLNASYTATVHNIAYELYNLHGELGAEFDNLSDMIIDAQTQWESDWESNWSQQGVDGVLYVVETDSLYDSTTPPVEGISFGMEGRILCDGGNGNGYLLKSDGKTKLLSACHNSQIYREWLEHPNRPGKYRWVYTCKCSKPHALNRQQILDSKITFYSASYEAKGPEHEIYISQGHGLAFAINANTVHISLRSADGGSVTVQAYNPTTKAFETVSNLSALTNRTEMYYDFSKYLTNGYIILKNTGSGMLAIDNVKSMSSNERSITVNYELAALATELFTENYELTVDESVQMAHTLALQNDITVKYIAKTEQLAQYDSFYMEVTIPVYEGNELVDTKTVRLEPVAEGATYGFYLEGISAKQMNDTLTARIYMQKDGEIYVSKTNEYSVANYAYNMLAKAEASDSLKTVCANLLRYGSEAQQYFNYRTDALVDEELAQEQMVYLTDTDTLALVNHRAMLNDLDAPAVSFKSATLVLNNKVIIRYVLNLAGFEGNVDELSVRLRYLNDDGETVYIDLTEFEAVDEASGRYAVECDTLAAKQMRTLVTAAIYHGETQISRSVQYSIESYAANAKDEVAQLCKAMIAYGDAANAFFAN